MKTIPIIFSIVILGCMSACAQNATNTNIEMKFIKAAENNEIEKLQNFLKEDVDIETKDSDKRTALMVATYENNIDAAKLLIEAGAK